MTPRRYRRKPVEVEAVQWTGENFEEVSAFCKRHNGQTYPAHRAVNQGLLGYLDPKGRYALLAQGDWLTSDFGVCRESEFEATYEPVEDRPDADAVAAKLHAPAGDTKEVEA